MWFKVEQKRSSAGQKFVVRCDSEIAGARVIEERPAQGVAAAKRAAEILASTLNLTATVYGTDANGEFIYGVFEVAEGAADASSPLDDAQRVCANQTFPQIEIDVRPGRNGGKPQSSGSRSKNRLTPGYGSSIFATTVTTALPNSGTN